MVAEAEGEGDSGVFDLTPTSPVYSPAPSDMPDKGVDRGHTGSSDGDYSAELDGAARGGKSSAMSRPLLSPDDSLDSYREAAEGMSYGGGFGYHAAMKLGGEEGVEHSDIQLHDILNSDF